MTDHRPTEAPKHRSSTLLLLGCVLTAYWTLLIRNLGAQWSIYEQYNYGWSVPFLCAYLIWRKLHSSCSSSSSTEPPNHRSTGLRPPTSGLRPPFSTFYFLLSALFLLYAPTRFFHEANPTWRLTSLLWTLEVIAITLLLLSLYSRQTEPRNLRNTETLPPADLRPLSSLPSPLAFPICFFLVAVPWPSGMETLLTQSLMHWNAGTTVEFLGLCGVPAAQHGNVIEISAGVIGIDEACSGIRSLQATLMISLFFGEFYTLSVIRRIVCVFAGFALAYIFNIGRTLLLVSVASSKGISAMARWHDPAGVTILVACFLGLWALSLLLRGNRAEDNSSLPAPRSSSPSRPPSSVLRPLISAFCFLLLTEAVTQLWYRSHEHAPASGATWAVQLPNDPRYKTIEISKNIRSQFRYDNGFEGHWQSEDGAMWQIYYFRWLPMHSLNKRVAVHLAKTHGPEKCLPRSGMTLKQDLGTLLTVPLETPPPRPLSSFPPSSPLPLALHQYIFEMEGRTLHVFYGIYEDSTGSEALANRRLDTASRIRAALSGSRNYGQRFLEIAVSGYDRPEDARAALERELSKLVTRGNPGP